jgi:putative membrane-bound dehydrogenase-like protein
MAGRTRFARRGWGALALVCLGAASAATQETPKRTPAEERAGFALLEGFEIELVACEPAMGKVVDIAFDDSGRMWAITAREYPLDANESESVAERYRLGGRDRVLIFDEPWHAGPQVPRVFAEGLFLPLALLPLGSGVLVGQGPEILRLHDDDGDGRCDRREVILKGFGIQDSHLLPHRFVRAPGDWIYLAQGAYNSSRVETRRGETVDFKQCKLARFSPDGERFEVVGVGLNNIWGFVLDRHGDKWIQEANDLGYSLVPFEHGGSYPGIGLDRLRPYSPWQPPLATFRLGGTGLSGLARCEDRGGFPPPFDTIFFVANPILSALQSIQVLGDPTQPEGIKLERGPDLLTSEDPNFRPVAIHFGPDGCLYVVDWYNPIISHNEVERNHPARDKTSSRIWRIRHEQQPHRVPRDVAAAKTSELVDLLGAETTVTARAAWHQIGARGARELVAPLEQLARDAGAPLEKRILAVWSLDDLQRVSLETVAALAADSEYALRREAARIASAMDLTARELRALFGEAPGESDSRVRRELIAALASASDMDQSGAALLAAMARPLPAGPRVTPEQSGAEVLAGIAATIAFERSLVRQALEAWPRVVLALCDSDAGQDLELEQRIFLLLAGEGPQAAERLATALVQADRAPTAEEFAELGQYAAVAEVQAALTRWLERPSLRGACLEHLLAAWGPSRNPELVEAMGQSVRALVEQEPTAENRRLLLRVAAELPCGELEADVVLLLEAGQADSATCLGALLEIGCRDAELFFRCASSSLPGTALRRTAVLALAEVHSLRAFELLEELWPLLAPGARRAAVAVLLSRRESARWALGALASGRLDPAALDAAGLRSLAEQLGESEDLDELRQLLASEGRQVLLLSGGGGDFAAGDLVIDGAFTLEAWVWLAPGIDSADGLLAAPDIFDFNFHAGRARLWLGPEHGDVIVARRAVAAETWVHVALTRSTAGELAIYIDGELDNSSGPIDGMPVGIAGLAVGRSQPGAGCAARFFEWRLWSRERSPEEIGAAFRLCLSRGPAAPGLEWVVPGDSVKLSGAARFEAAFDLPTILDAAELRAEAERFELFARLAAGPGDLRRGAQLFADHCAACHRVAGQGTSIGPALDGVAAKGIAGLLRSILSPSAGIEAGYRTLVVRTTSGELLTGILAAEDSAGIVLRRQDRADLQLPQSQIEGVRFDPLSLMPSGLLEALTPSQAADLLRYLLSLQ